MYFAPELLKRFKSAQNIVVFTGAGISAESGIRTFRDDMEGLWQQYDVEDVVSIEGFHRNPTLVWRWHEWFRAQANQAMPNAAHWAVSLLADYFPNLCVITQNIDGLHQKAGSPSVIELHGTVHRLRCFDRGHRPDHWPSGAKMPPHCSVFGSLLRHEVVWFGENLPEVALNSAMQKAESADFLLVIGTSSVVYPAAQIPQIAAHSGACVTLINPEETPLSSLCDYFLQGAAGSVLPALAQAIWQNAFTDKLSEKMAGIFSAMPQKTGD